MDAVDWRWREPIEYLELFAYPGEIPELAKLARRFLDSKEEENDFDALKHGLLALTDALEAAGYKWGGQEWTALDHAYMAIAECGEDDWTLPAWRAVASLKYAEVERISRLVRRVEG